MADRSLEYELLQVAGIQGTPKSGGGSKGSRHRSHDSRDDSSSEDDYREHNHDYDSKIPPKKRLDMSAKDSRDDHRGSDSDPSFGSDLYKDEADREALSKMTELERELILAGRGEERDKFLNKIRDSKRRNQSIQDQSSTPISRSRASTNQSNRSKDALNKLVESRSAKQQRQNDLNRDFSGRANLSQSLRDEWGRRKSNGNESSGSDSDSSDSHSDYADRHGNSDDDHTRNPDPDATPEDLNTIVLPRSKLNKWCWEPFFEEIVVGCLVRVGIGMNQAGQPVYRVCEVAAVDAKDSTKQYKFEGKMTHKYLDCQWGDKRARWQMDRISDKPPQRTEFEEWLRELDRINARRMTKSEVAVKRDSLQKANSYTYDAVTVKQMLEEKRMAMSRPRIVAVEKDRLEKEMELAKQKNDQEEIQRIKDELVKLEEYAQSQNMHKNTKVIRLAEMNKRNKQENFRIASDSGNRTQQEANLRDPFSRRWTRSQNYYRRGGKVEEAGKNKDEQGASAQKGKAEAASSLNASEAQTGKQEAGTKHAVVEDGDGMDNVMWSKHAFDLPISLEPLQRWGGKTGASEAFIFRKRRQEEKFGVKLNKTPKCAHVLTINDYKRRRGLL